MLVSNLEENGCNICLSSLVPHTLKKCFGSWQCTKPYKHSLLNEVMADAICTALWSSNISAFFFPFFCQVLNSKKLIKQTQTNFISSFFFFLFSHKVIGVKESHCPHLGSASGENPKQNSLVCFPY